MATEDWKWITADLELPYGHEHGLRAITGASTQLTKKEERQREKLREEQERIETEYADHDELPDEIDQRHGEIEKQRDAFERRPAVYDPAEIAIAGAFVTVDEDGALVVERGWVRPEDERAETIDGASQDDDDADGASRRMASAPSSPSADSWPSRGGRGSHQASSRAAGCRTDGAPHRGAKRCRGLPLPRACLQGLS